MSGFFHPANYHIFLNILFFFVYSVFLKTCHVHPKICYTYAGWEIFAKLSKLEEIQFEQRPHIAGINQLYQICPPIMKKAENSTLVTTPTLMMKMWIE